ncbi:metallophosphoesterase [Longimicrobium sp.]|uniref:metallophosphoesterase n=1 Tax=Longimicrobium sp. TaxID=2029185 RepID=UPI002E34007C|nr:metallophosphoesterase [Longimicrobium sp.]HEX6041033.1 metallophosphoesterase [Longimicrobium sp.]
MNRRRFLALSAAAAGTGSLSLGGYAAYVEPHRAGFTHHRVNARTSPAQREITFVQVSDLHLHRVGAMHRRIATRVNAIRPELLLFTGDSVDKPDRLGELRSLLALFDARTPKYAILGNWEHWSGVDLGELADVYHRANCRLLVNESAIHDAGGRGLVLTGLDDLIGGRPDGRVLATVPDADAHLLLAHCPEHRDRLIVPALGAIPAPVDVSRITMMLSGHTHGGQVSLLGWTPILPAGSGRYVRGWFRDPGAVPLYVSRGIGTSVMPVRLGAPPEVAVFTMWV